MIVHLDKYKIIEKITPLYSIEYDIYLNYIKKANFYILRYKLHIYITLTILTYRPYNLHIYLHTYNITYTYTYIYTI